jgi:hypothetical protein
MNFPPPPSSVSAQVSSQVETPAAPFSLPVPTPLVVEKRSGELTDNEWSLILQAELSPKNRKTPHVISFIESFVRCKSIPQASAEAGIEYTVGYNIRHKADVSACIQKIIDKSLMKYGFDASEIMERTKEIVDFDPIALYNNDGTFKENLHDIDPATRRNIKKMKVKNLWGDHEDMNGIKQKIIVGRVIEYEFYDKMKAIDLAGKEKEMFKNTTKVEHAVSKDMANILLASLDRGTKASVTYQNAVPTTYTPVEDDEDDT